MKLIFKNKKFIVAFLLMLAGAFIAYKFWRSPLIAPEAPKIVEVETVKRKDIEKTVTLVGKVKPIRQTTFISHKSGILKAPKVYEGQEVKKGSVLIEIENQELIREVNHAKETISLLESNYQRQQKLVYSKSKSKKSLENARENLLKARIAYEQAANRLKSTQFIAPYDGVCGVFIAREGKDLKEGDTVVSFYDTSRYALDIGVPESILKKIKEKAPLSCLGKKGEIKSIQRIIDPNSRMGLAYAEISNEVEACLGSIVDVNVVVESCKNCLSLLKSSIFMKGKNSFAYKITKGQAELVSLKLGLEGDERVQITEGIKEGDQIILWGQESIWPTRAVKALNSKEKPKN